MTIVESTGGVIGGVDTHLDVHVAAAVDTVGGRAVVAGRRRTLTARQLHQDRPLPKRCARNVLASCLARRREDCWTRDEVGWRLGADPIGSNPDTVMMGLLWGVVVYSTVSSR
jgi:hypothetical protein